MLDYEGLHSALKQPETRHFPFTYLLSISEEEGHGWPLLILITGSSVIALGYCMIKAPLAFAMTGPDFES